MENSSFPYALELSQKKDIRAYTVVGEAGNGKPVLDRELASLNAIRNHNPKFLLTMDFTPNVSHNGIRQINALDWLLGEH